MNEALNSFGLYYCPKEFMASCPIFKYVFSCHHGKVELLFKKIHCNVPALVLMKK